MKNQELTYGLLQKEINGIIILFEKEKNHSIEVFWNDFSEFIKGKASLKTFIFNLYFIIICLGLTLIIPRILYPTFYSMRTHFISSLGVYLNNPQGAPIFNTGIILIGFLQIPLTMNLYQILEKGNLKLAKISRSFSIIGALGFIIVGIFPSNISAPHLTGAFMVFIGYYLAANINWIILIQKRKRSEEFKSNTSHLSFLFLVFNLIANQFFISVIIDLIYPNHILHSYGFFSSSLWEWIYMIAIISWLSIYFYNINKSRLDGNKINNSIFAYIQKARPPLVHN